MGLDYVNLKVWLDGECYQMTCYSPRRSVELIVLFVLFLFYFSMMILQMIDQYLVGKLGQYSNQRVQVVDVGPLKGPFFF